MHFPILVLLFVWAQPSEVEPRDLLRESRTTTDFENATTDFAKEQSSNFDQNESGNPNGEIKESDSQLHHTSDTDGNYHHFENVKGYNETSMKSAPQFREEDFLEAMNFGLRAMNELYYNKEPRLYALGLYLEDGNPAKYLAAFNDQTEEAKHLAKYSYAILESTTQFVKKHPSNNGDLPPLPKSVIRQSALQEQCPRRGTPVCPPTNSKYRTFDGSCNNFNHLWWGSAMSAMQRFLPAVYDDGIQTVRRSRNNGEPLPSARAISSFIHEDRNAPMDSVTHMLMQWGQFIDHDLTATGQTRSFNGSVPQCCLGGGIDFQPSEFMHPECLPIAVSPQDHFFGRLGVKCLEFTRSGAAPNEDCAFSSREQLSQVTSYLDASMIYSSHQVHSDSLRLFRKGLLQYGKLESRQTAHPLRESDLCRRGSLSTSCFRAGDGRLSEQPALTSLHVLLLRLHNRIATTLSSVNPHWNDETTFQETRKIVGAVVQHITYREFLPIVLGSKVMETFDLQLLRRGYYEGYDPEVNPTVANAFSTAAYRFGHSLVQNSFVRFDGFHRPIPNNVTIHDEFSNPANLETAGSVDRLLLGLVNQPCQKRDEFISNELTNHLFQISGFPFGMDLASINIQRGRDHGLPPYVNWREPCSLSPIQTFEDLEKVMSPTIVAKFRLLYSSVQDIDLFTAGLAEKSVSGGLVGPTFACIIAQQFRNLRRGDRFWYENPFRENGFTPRQLQQIRRVSLAQVLCKTMDDIKTIQPFVFLTPDNLRNRRTSCEDRSIGQIDLNPWRQSPSSGSRIVDSPEEANDRMQKTVTKPQSPQTKGNTGPARIHGKFPPRPQKPNKSNIIHQQNKIVVKRPPFGNLPNNFSIVVQNNAVNSPVFVNDAIYGSHVQSIETTTWKPTFLATTNVYPLHYPIPTSYPQSNNPHQSPTFSNVHINPQPWYNDPNNNRPNYQNWNDKPIDVVYQHAELSKNDDYNSSKKMDVSQNRQHPTMVQDRQESQASHEVPKPFTIRVKSKLEYREEFRNKGSLELESELESLETTEAGIREEDVDDESTATTMENSRQNR